MSNIDKLTSRLDGVKSNGYGKYLARCPAHDDKSPSLAIKEIDGDRILIKCWSGCDTQSVLAALGLTFADLFPERIPDPTAPKTKYPKLSAYELFPLLVQEAMILALACNDFKEGKQVSDADFKRVQQAYNTVVRLNTEVNRK